MKVVVMPDGAELPGQGGGLDEDAARAVAAGAVPYALRSHAPRGGRVELADHAMNAVSLADGGRTTLAFPAPVAGRARSFLATVAVSNGSTFAFEGAGVFVGDDANALAAPADGTETAYFFTEIAAGRFMAAAKTLTEIEV